MSISSRRECMHPVAEGAKCQICASIRVAIARAGEPMPDPLRTGRADLLARIAELEVALTTARSDNEMLRAHNASLVSGRSYAAMLENLSSVQATSTRLLNNLRGVRCFLREGPGEHLWTGIEDILGAAWSAECKHGPFHPRLTNIPDVREVEALVGAFDLRSVSSILEDVRTACTAAEKDGTVSWALLALEEMLEALVEALRGDVPALRTEVAQLGCVCAAWLEAIERRGMQ